MKDKHIIGVLENTGFKNLSEQESAQIETHTARCSECREAFQAAKISLLMLKNRAAETAQPPPFFEARVMNAWREQQAETSPSGIKRLWQMWQDSKILVSSMAASALMFAVLSGFAPQRADETLAQASADDYYSAETIVFNRQPNDVTDAEIFLALYEGDGSEK